MNIEPTFDTWTVLFLVVAIHGFILSAIFFARDKGRKIPDLLLGTFLLLFSINLISYVVFWTRYNLEFPHLMGLSATFHFLYGPILFFYAFTVLKPDRPWKWWDAAHFVPFLVYLGWLSPLYLSSAAEKFAMIEQSMQEGFTLSGQQMIIVSLKSLHMIIYAGIIYYMLKPGSVGSIFKLEKLSNHKKRWIGMISYSFMGYVGSYMLFFLLVETIGYGLEYDYIIAFAMSGSIFAIGYMGLAKPEYLTEAHNGAKYERSSLGEKEADRHLESLLDYMETEKPYRDGDLRLNDLAESLSIPSHHLSQVINERLNKNFFEFINHYRVKEAKELLSDPEKKGYKVLRVAFETGFNNKTTFNNAFKDEVGMTPSAYRNQQLNGR